MKRKGDRVVWNDRSGRLLWKTQDKNRRNIWCVNFDDGETVEVYEYKLVQEV